MNLMSRTISIVEASNISVNQLLVAKNYEKTETEINKSLDGLWSTGTFSFAQAFEKQLARLEAEKLNEKIAVQALCISLWMDRKLTYESTADTNHLSLYPLLPLRQDHPVHCDGLNANASHTGNTLHPKYDVAKIYDPTQDKFRPLSTRDAFKGLNGLLHHICYTSSGSLNSATVHVHNIVVPCEYEAGREDGHFRVAFCPMSNDQKLLNITNRDIKKLGVGTREGIWINSVNSSILLYGRFLNSWHLACENQADIFFAPEMLGIDRLYKEENGYNSLIRELARTTKKTAPLLTVLPSQWKEGVNQTAVVYQTGKTLGYQRKLTPYYDLTAHKQEALLTQKEWQLLLIHIPNLYRIAIMLCADFLEMQHPEMRDLICGELGATLIIVPSYSRGEGDFTNVLPSLKSYGTTVVWGNCCGAVKGYPRIIGACGLAGVDTPHRFGTECRCDNRCVQGCLFTVDLPLHLVQEKPSGPKYDRVVRHHLLC